ncbi:MAG: hypothetical protein R3230_01040 [Nitrosopumilaceae archaeon]|nr:hypothetical protein [Nitrosopumilaceae archaeon]
MPKPITKYVTIDGQEFNTESAACRHEKDLLYKNVEQFINNHFGVSHMPSVHKTVVRMTDNTKSLKKELGSLLDLIESMYVA